jgi:hypothetical protein
MLPGKISAGSYLISCTVGSAAIPSVYSHLELMSYKLVEPCVMVNMMERKETQVFQFGSKGKNEQPI